MPVVGLERAARAKSVRGTLFYTGEALIKSARAYSERFCFLRKFGKVRNTVCISGFPCVCLYLAALVSADNGVFSRTGIKPLAAAVL